VRFLKLIYADIHQLLVNLDKHLAERGWKPTENSRISYELSNKIANFDKWVMSYLWRFYAPAGSNAGFQRLIGYIVYLDPPVPLDKPLLMAVAAHFPRPVAWDAVVKKWEASDPAFEALATTTELRQLSAQECGAFLPDADHVVGKVVQLCTLTGPQPVLDLCVIPLLRAGELLADAELARG
jgi:hypothetical protein